MKKISLLSWALCILLTAFNSAGILPAPTSTLTLVPSSTATSTASPTETPAPPITPTPTESSLSIEELESLVPKDAKLVLSFGNFYPYEFAPVGAKFANLSFVIADYPKEMTVDEQKILVVEVAYRNQDGIQKAMVKVGDQSWGPKQDSSSGIFTHLKSLGISSADIVTMDELKALIIPGDLFDIDLLTHATGTLDLECPGGEYCNNREMEAAAALSSDSDLIQQLSNAEKISPGKIIKPFRINVYLP